MGMRAMENLHREGICRSDISREERLALQEGRGVFFNLGGAQVREMRTLLGARDDHAHARSSPAVAVAGAGDTAWSVPAAGAKRSAT